jgi:hypothetical protein
MLLEDVVPDQPSGSASHQDVRWEMLLSQHAHQAYTRGQRIVPNCTHFEGYSPAVTSAKVHANMLCDDGNDLLLSPFEEKKLSG